MRSHNVMAVMGKWAHQGHRKGAETRGHTADTGSDVGPLYLRLPPHFFQLASLLPQLNLTAITKTGTLHPWWA